MKGPCASREAVLQLAGRSENWLNEHFTLAGECVPPTVLEQASCIGRQWAKEAWLFEQSAEQNLYRLGVKRIRWMSPMEECAFAARALYDPQAVHILVSKARLDEMEELQQVIRLNLFSPQALYDRLLAHECFHHLEEQRGMRLDEALAEGSVLPPSVRDVGAHAFSNFIFGRPVCQAVDLLWLAVRRPDALTHISY